jgi:hypothetical protein
MADYVDPDITTDETDLYQELLDEREALDPGWSPADGSPENIWAAIWSRKLAETRQMIADYAQDKFRGFGRDILTEPAIEAQAAQATVTITAIDSAPHLLEAGTDFSMVAGDGSLVGFEATEDQTITTSGSVVLTATEEGTASSGLSGEVQQITSVPWIASIALVGSTSDGVDAEDDDTWTNRLVGETSLQWRGAVLAANFAVLALRIPGVARAVGFDGYNPDDGTENNQRMITVAVIGEDGLDPGSTVKNAVDADLQGRREVTFIVRVVGPSITTVNVAFTAVAYAGYDPATVEAAAEEAVRDYLDPAKWGTPQSGDASSNGGWVDQPNVDRFEIATVLNEVEGLNRVTALTINGDVLDITLTGKAALASAGTVAGTVTAP